jgi:peptidoglycan/LPS O-acetylase OafA/YrhL
MVLSSFNYWPVNHYFKEWLFYGVISLAIPFSFYATGISNLDKRIGELSYPIYITHILINNIIFPLFFVPLAISRNWQPLAIFLFSVLLSLLLIKYLQNPVEKIRNRGSKK